MQKVEGSSPFSRFAKAPQMRGFFLEHLPDKALSQTFSRGAHPFRPAEK
jgi:hypothetical protein